MASAHHHHRSASDHFGLLLDAVHQSAEHQLASPGPKVRRLDIQHLLAVSKQVDPDDATQQAKVISFFYYCSFIPHLTPR